MSYHLVSADPMNTSVYTCVRSRKLCSCKLGASGIPGEDLFVQNATALQRLFTKSPLLFTTGEDTVEVLVPRLSKDKKKKKKSQSAEAGALESEAAIQDEKIEAAEGVPDGQLPDDAIPVVKTPPGIDEQDAGDEKISCGLCAGSETVGIKKQKRMLSCESCQKMFHRSCLKQWAEHRDLFNWASWRCPSCRTCETCKETGDFNKFLFCKRCDVAYHSNCQQSGPKQATKGPYLCPKHVHCHSCSTRVAGGGLSSRWMLSYLFCDACGRLFGKNKYCPVCLKVYRESEPTPMVCCDNCEHWVHCRCDGISDEKYQQFQADPNLRFTCAACRGECFKAETPEDAVTELWKRKDEADRDDIANARAAAGFPSEAEMMKFYPSSDDEMEEEPPAPLVPAKESSKKLVIKINMKKGGGNNEKSAKKEARSGKKKSSNDAPTDVPNVEETQEVEGGEEEDFEVSHKGGSSKRKKSKTKRHAPSPPLPQAEKSSADLKTVPSSGTKVTLRVKKGVESQVEENPSASEDSEGDDETHSQRNEDHVQSWGQSENRRRRVPSSKFRDTDKVSEQSPQSEAKQSKGRSDESELGLKKKGEESEGESKQQGEGVLKVKVRKQSAIVTDEENNNSARGHRSKRKRSSCVGVGGVENEEEDDSLSLQNIGLDAVAKRVEVRHSSDNTWRRGTITSVNVRKSQYTIQFDSGEKKSQKYGKDKMRLLSKK